MIKIPGTSAGLSAIATLIGEGINFNVSLMFSLHHYDVVSEQGNYPLLSREKTIPRLQYLQASNSAKPGER